MSKSHDRERQSSNMSCFRGPYKNDVHFVTSHRVQSEAWAAPCPNIVCFNISLDAYWLLIIDQSHRTYTTEILIHKHNTTLLLKAYGPKVIIIEGNDKLHYPLL